MKLSRDEDDVTVPVDLTEIGLSSVCVGLEDVGSSRVPSTFIRKATSMVSHEVTSRSVGCSSPSRSCSSESGMVSEKGIEEFDSVSVEDIAGDDGEDELSC